MAAIESSATGQACENTNVYRDSSPRRNDSYHSSIFGAVELSGWVLKLADHLVARQVSYDATLKLLVGAVSTFH
jgi:hypothetical protein